MNVTMKKKILLLFALFLALVSSAQTQFRAIPFDEVLKAAQQEKKSCLLISTPIGAVLAR